MRKLSLLTFAILILGCGTETSAVKEPSPVAESGQHLRITYDELEIIRGDVSDGEVNVDPIPLNLDGITFWFNTYRHLYKIDLQLKSGKSLNWSPSGVVNDEPRSEPVRIQQVFGSPPLEYDTEYVIKIYAQNYPCLDFYFEIVFHTKPKP